MLHKLHTYRRSLLHIILHIIYIIPLLAVPAQKVKTTLTLADGTRIAATLRGDETFHFYEAEDGKAYTMQEGIPAEIGLKDAYAELQRGVQANNKRRMARRNAKRKSKWGASSNHISGKYRGLVILVNFTDASLTYSQTDFDAVFNQKGYSQHNFGGSVHDYFYSQSYGQLDLTFDVIGPVNLSQALSYYGENDRYGNDKRAAEMVCEALRAVDQEVDFGDYDWDGDGEVEQVFVVYAGYGEHADAPAYTIWPHEYELSSAAYYGDGDGALTLDGVRLDTYACSCELGGKKGTELSGIGTACHEFSHCLYLPDMYDTSGSSFGMGEWDVMDYGCYNGYNNDGGTPTGYTSYERMYCGWLTPIELDSPCQISDMPALTDQPVAYILKNAGNSNEYYLLENRQQHSWDEYNVGHGMLILHVDFNANAWSNNEVNAIASRQRMTIIPADNKLTAATLSGDPWPGTSGNTELTDTSTPAAKLYNANSDGRKFMGSPITDIRESESGLISFTFSGGTNSILSPFQTPSSSVIYNLQGQRITSPQKGIYIKDGKKFIDR